MLKGDFSRNSFHPSKDFTRVLMQQGRLQLDADWNEQVSIFWHFFRSLTRDLVGPYGFEVLKAAQDFTGTAPRNPYGVIRTRFIDEQTQAAVADVSIGAQATSWR